MTVPRVEVDLKKIRHNVRQLVQNLDRRGIGTTGVTKAVCGHPDIALAMLEGGVSGLADARIENVERMRRFGIECPISLLRTPMVSQADRVTRGCGTSYNTELDTIHMLASSARRSNTVHNIILMVEMGDLREGIMPGDLQDIAGKAKAIAGISLEGIATNSACLGGVAPDPRLMAEFSTLVDQTEKRCGLLLKTISGGNSAGLPWALGGDGTGRVNDMRLGEAILLGVDPISGHQIDGLFTDAFTLVAEVIESKIKPERGAWPTNGAAFSGFDLPDDCRCVRQSLVAIGNQDTDVEGLSLPLGFSLIGATSDHLVVDTGNVYLPIGAELPLQPNYAALMRVMNAPGVEKVTRNRKPKARTGPVKRCNSDLAMV